MVGRRRRAASNSVAEDGITYYKENTVLVSIDSAFYNDFNDWPSFELVDVTVYRPDGTLANLLNVDLEGPFITRGRLVVKRDEEKYYINRFNKTRPTSIPIQIQGTVSFSIGLSDDSSSRMPILWASGAAGWYEITPSSKYMAIYDTMVQGIRLHYAIMDQYEDAEKLRKKKKYRRRPIEDVMPLDEALFRYAMTVGDGVTLPEAHQRLQQQAVFLLSHLKKELPEYQSYLASRFPELQKKFAEREKNPRRAEKAKSSVLEAAAFTPRVPEALPYTPREKSSSLDIVGERKRGRPPKASSVARGIRNSQPVDTTEIIDLSNDTPESHGKGDTVMIDAPGGSSANAKTIPDRLRKSNVPQPPQGSTPTLPSVQATLGEAASSTKSTGNVVVDMFQDVRQTVLAAHAQGRGGRHPNEKPINTWLSKIYLNCTIKYDQRFEVCLYNAREIVRLLGPEWHDSELYKWAKDNMNKPPTFEFISERDILKLARRDKKQETTRREQPIKNSQADIAPQPKEKKPNRGRPSGKAAGLRPSTGSKKRLRHEADFEDDMDVDEDGALRRTAKKSRYFTDDDDDDADVQDEVSSENEAEPVGSSKEALTRLVIRAEKLPSTRPQGPNRTWTCEEPACGYVVRAADEEEGQSLIAAHYEEHEKEARDVAQEVALNRVNLAQQEAARGRLPIDHLLEKIRGLGEKTQKRREDTQLNGQPLPQPIKRALMI